jgi:ribose transport system ATP-binding protein
MDDLSTTAPAQPGLLQTIAIRKEYPSTLALDDVSVSFEGGKVSALLGKNGAGKSTLVKILAGTAIPTAGKILVNGKPVVLRSAQDAFDHGIATVYQELSLIPDLTIGENILLGRLPHRAGGLLIDWPRVFARASEVLGGMKVDLDVRKKVSSLGVAQQQIVEIAKAMSFGPSVLMLDEPTSALAHHETEGLFRLIRQLAARGVAIIHITHRLQELKHIADTVTVLRDGRLVGSVPMAQSTAQSIVQMMFGKVEQKQRPMELKAGKEPILEVKNLTRAGKFQKVNFTLNRGEVLGIAGMLGSGRTELLRALFGADPFDSGEIIFAGQKVKSPTPQRMCRLGLAFTPEERKEQALVQILSTRSNACLASLDRVSFKGLLTRGRERAVVNRMVDKLAIKLPDMEQPVSSLSGGNQQKIVVAKWLNTHPKVILFDEPTRGIDVQAKQHIFQVMWDLSRQGISSIFVSSELEELVEVCHRILIMKKGMIVDEADPATLAGDDLFVRCMEA